MEKIENYREDWKNKKKLQKNSEKCRKNTNRNRKIHENEKDHKNGSQWAEIVSICGQRNGVPKQPTQSLLVLMSFLTEYGSYSGYKLNVQKTQVLSFNHTPPKIFIKDTN